MKRLLSISLFISCLAIALTSCNKSNEESDDYKQIIYTSDVTYDYELTDSDEYGKAIYPDEALIKLREIKAHNLENGVSWPSEGYIADSRHSNAISFGTLTDFIYDYEIYLQNEYYQIRENTFNSEGLHRVYDEFRFEDEKLLHEKYDSSLETPSQISESTLEEMTLFKEENSQINKHYDYFLGIVNLIEENQLIDVYRPKEIKCYTSGEGSLYINIYRNYTTADGIPYRRIYRIVYQDYLPVLSIIHRVDNILIDKEHKSELSVCKFIYDIDEIRGEIYE